MQARRRITVVRTVAPRGHDLVAALDESRVQRALDHFFEQARLIHGLVRGFGNLGHQRPVFGDVGHVVRRVVAENGDAVERAVVLGEIHPALGCQLGRRFAAQAKPEDVRG